ncbi:hypothetical protein U1Q18_019746 [Sarracenia purpurea var. burkii]
MEQDSTSIADSHYLARWVCSGLAEQRELLNLGSCGARQLCFSGCWMVVALQVGFYDLGVLGGWDFWLVSPPEIYVPA